MITRADSKLCFVILERSSPSEEIKGTLSFTFIRYFATFPSPQKKQNNPAQDCWIVLFSQKRSYCQVLPYSIIYLEQR